jgi:hypothetical protein
VSEYGPEQKTLETLAKSYIEPMFGDLTLFLQGAKSGAGVTTGLEQFVANP